MLKCRSGDFAVLRSLVRHRKMVFYAAGFARNNPHGSPSMPTPDGSSWPLGYSVPGSVAFGTPTDSKSMRTKRLASPCGGSPPMIILV